MKKKGFTLVELLVVIAIIALLMGILMPALARVRMIAYRMVCGSNLSGIGKALLLYAGDAQETYPMPGYQQLPVVYAVSGKIPNFSGGETFGTPQNAFAFPNAGGQATIGSVFYMLVKYQDVSPKQFNCKGDSRSEIFKLTTYTTTTQTDITKVYDFGSAPGKHNSYAYHFPFAKAYAANAEAGYPVSVNAKPGCPLAADRNPALDRNAQAYIRGDGSTPGGLLPSGATGDLPCTAWVTNNNEYRDKDFMYNAYPHQREGQNVLYNDGHVKFESTANVGVDNDNIYQRELAPPSFIDSSHSRPAKREREACGIFPNIAVTTGTYGQLVPAEVEDSMLVNEVAP